MDRWIVLLLVFPFLCLGSVSPLQLERVHFVDRTFDSKVQNFLFRGNQPQDENGTFAYDELRSFLEIKAMEEGGFHLPAEYLIYDISFLNPRDEGVPLQTEFAFFANNPTQGKLIWWELVGDSISPQKVTNQTQLVDLSIRLPYWQLDDLPLKMLQVRQFLFTRYEKPVVIYFHCGQGQDRTGEFAASYDMTYKAASFQQVYLYNTKMGMDVPENIHAMQWYCNYLKYSTRYALDCTIPAYVE